MLRRNCPQHGRWSRAELPGGSGGGKDQVWQPVGTPQPKQPGEGYGKSQGRVWKETEAKQLLSFLSHKGVETGIPSKAKKME